MTFICRSGSRISAKGVHRGGVRFADSHFSYISHENEIIWSH